MTNTQLPKQTIERIEREAYSYGAEHIGKPYSMNTSQLRHYTSGATREALLVLPVLEAVRSLLEAKNESQRTVRKCWLELKFEAYEALNKESGK